MDAAEGLSRLHTMPEVPQLRGVWLERKAQYWPVLVSTTTGSPGSTGLDGSSGLMSTKVVVPLPLEPEPAPPALLGVTKPSRPVAGSMPSTCPLGLVTVTGVPGGRMGLVVPAWQGGCSGQMLRHAGMQATRIYQTAISCATAFHNGCYVHDYTLQHWPSRQAVAIACIGKQQLLSHPTSAVGIRL